MSADTRPSTRTVPDVGFPMPAINFNIVLLPLLVAAVVVAAVLLWPKRVDEPPPSALQVTDQLRAREVDLGEAIAAVMLRLQPAGLEPGVQHLGLESRLQQEFAHLHGHAPMAWR